jgi:protein TonB
MHAPGLPRFRTARRLASHWQLNARYVRYCAIALLLSTTCHVLYLLYGPAPEARPYEITTFIPEVIDIPDEIDIPEPPKEVPPPPLPRELDPTADEDFEEEDVIPATQLPDLGDWRGRPPIRESSGGFLAYETAPVPVKRVQPDYPDLARQAHAEGTVRVQVLVDATGRVVEVVVVQSDTVASLNQAALAAARRWLFRPALQRDTPVPARVVLQFHFSLR